jgi:hypothetical protein
MIHPVDRDEQPPLLSTWRRLYSVVILYLTALIAAFYLFMRAFTP